MFLVENGYLPSAGVTQLVECDLAKVDVAGSNPVSRSKISLILVTCGVKLYFAVQSSTTRRRSSSDMPECFRISLRTESCRR